MNDPKRALIFGVGGQDGSYLAELLREQGYVVYGTHRRSSVDNLTRLAPALLRDPNFVLQRADLNDPSSVERIISTKVRNRTGHTAYWDEVYNLADQDHVGWSESLPAYSASVTYGGAASILSAVWKHCPNAKVFQPVSSTVFGPREGPCDELTPLDPRTPYACAKAGAWLLAKAYRAMGIYVSCGIMFNHDSPRRGPDYLLQRICRQAKADKAAVNDPQTCMSNKTLQLYDVEMKVDIGYAREYVWAMWRMLQLLGPDDFVIGSDRAHTIADITSAAYGAAGLSWRQFVDTYTSKNKPLASPTANSSKARIAFDWRAYHDAILLAKNLVWGGLQ